MSKTFKIAIPILIALIIIGALLAVTGTNTFMAEKQSASIEGISSSTDYQPINETISAQSGTAASAVPSGDKSIDKDAAALDADMAVFNSSSASADKGLSDKPVAQ